MATESSKPQPPYVSFGVFKTTIQELGETIVPTGPLDRRVLSWLSGADYGALIPALRFLGLIDDDRKATAEYRTLVDAVKNPEDWKVELLALVLSKYEPIVGKLDYMKGTASELEQAFKNYGVSAGQMLTKTVRFYTKALQDAQVPVSPHITKPKPKTPRATAAKNGGKATKARASRTPEGERGHSDPPVIPNGVQRMPIPGVENGFIQYPTDLSVTHCDMLAAAVTMLRAYATARTSGGKEKKP